MASTVHDVGDGVAEALILGINQGGEFGVCVGSSFTDELNDIFVGCCRIVIKLKLE